MLEFEDKSSLKKKSSSMVRTEVVNPHSQKTTAQKTI